MITFNTRRKPFVLKYSNIDTFEMYDALQDKMHC